MIPRLLTERARHNFVQTRRTLQTLSYVACFTLILIAMFADPDHRILSGALNIFARLIQLILR